jgi:hypothetical protein
MSYWDTGLLASGQDFVANLDGTWAYVNFCWSWSASDSTALAAWYGSPDEGVTWFTIQESAGTSGTGQWCAFPGVTGDYGFGPVNAIKIAVLSGLSTTTHKVVFTGC